MSRTVYHHGVIRTMTGPDDVAEALIVQDGRIAAVGSDTAIESEIHADDEVIDLKGQAVLPGFIDAHSHILEQAQYFQYADISQARSFADIVQLLKDFARHHDIGPDSVLVGTGYDQNDLEEQRHPDAAVLDEVSTTVPIFIRHVSGHVGVANSALLRLAGITKDTPDPSGSRYGRIPGTQEPNGYAEELAALAPYYQVIEQRSPYDWPKLWKQAQDLYASYGITTAQNGASTADDIAVLADLAAHDAIQLDVVAYIRATEQPERIFDAYSQYDGTYSHHLKLGGWKFFLDGSPQARTAWLSKPYEGSPTYSGYAAVSDDVLTAQLKDAIDHGRQTLAHCNGDAASEQYLRCYEKALHESQYPHKDALRPVMIHCQTVRQDQLDRFAALHMIPSFFNAHTWYWGDVHVRNLGLERASHISPVRSALKRGLCYNLHRDTPIVKPDVLHSVWAAVARQTKSGRVLDEEERLTPYEALAGITSQAAYMYGEEQSKGTLEVGKRADLVVLDRDPAAVPTEDIRSVDVVSTIVAGVPVWHRT